MKENNEIRSSAHSKYRCQYHIVFAPKFRRKEIYGKLKKVIGQILRKLCEQKDVQIIEAEACPDHIHMLVSIPPHISIARFMGYLKGKSTLMIFDRHAKLKYKYGSRSFWCTKDDTRLPMPTASVRAVMCMVKPMKNAKLNSKK